MQEMLLQDAGGCGKHTFCSADKNIFWPLGPWENEESFDEGAERLATGGGGWARRGSDNWDQGPSFSCPLQRHVAAEHLPDKSIFPEHHIQYDTEQILEHCFGFLRVAPPPPLKNAIG